MTLLPRSCDGCRNGDAFEHSITMAFQPIVSTTCKRIFAHEALVRGVDGSGAASVFERVDDATRYAFDQACRTTAIRLAAELDLAGDGALLSINFLPNAVYDPRACIQVTLRAARMAGFPLDRILFEFTESEKVNPDHLLGILRHYRALGFLTAVDDFGAGYAGTGLLADFVPDVVKLDMHLIRGCDTCERRQTIVRHTVTMLKDMGIVPVCEGVETHGEYEMLRDAGVDLMQGYLFARPSLASLAIPEWPAEAAEPDAWPDAGETVDPRAALSCGHAAAP